MIAIRNKATLIKKVAIVQKYFMAYHSLQPTDRVSNLRVNIHRLCNISTECRECHVT